MAENAPIDWRLVVEQISRGEPAGEETLYRMVNGGARLFLQRRLGTRDVEDHVHDVFLTVVQAIRRGSVREPERLMGFVRTVLHRQLNAAISQIVGARENVSPGESISLLSDSDPDPEQRVLVQERLEAIKRGMKKLSDKEVEILTRFYLRGQDPERICNEMSLTMTQFTLRKSRAKGKLVALMQRADQKSGMQG